MRVRHAFLIIKFLAQFSNLVWLKFYANQNNKRSLESSNLLKNLRKIEEKEEKIWSGDLKLKYPKITTSDEDVIYSHRCEEQSILFSLSGRCFYQRETSRENIPKLFLNKSAEK